MIAVLVAATVARTADFSATAPTGQTLYYNITSSTTLSVVAPGGSSWSGYTAPAGRLQIPSQVTYNGTDYTVTAIANDALRQCMDLTSVTVPGTVKSIGYTAFFRCTALTSVFVADGLETIGRMAFAACAALDTIELPMSLVQIGISAFIGTAYESDAANWSGGMMCIGKYVVAVNTTIDSTVIVPYGMLGIGNGAFYYCHNLPKVVLPGGLRFIGNLAFSDCEVLDTVVMLAPEPPTLGDDAFAGVPSVTVVVPCGSGAAYRSAQCWSALNIVEDTCPVAIVNVADEEVSVAVVSGRVVVSGAHGSPVRVCDMMGRTVYAAQCGVHVVPLPSKGIYLVTVGGATRKVAYLK